MILGEDFEKSNRVAGEVRPVGRTKCSDVPAV